LCTARARRGWATARSGGAYADGVLEGAQSRQGQAGENLGGAKWIRRLSLSWDRYTSGTFTPVQWYDAAMLDAMDRLQQMSRWLAREARFFGSNRAVFEGFCIKLSALGVPLDRSWLHIRTLHPEYAGMSRLWRREAGVEERYLEHGFEGTSTYLASPVRYAVEERKTGRWHLHAGEVLPFPVLDEIRAAGYSDYVIAPLLYSSGTANAISWATRATEGFGDDDIELFHELLPAYAAIAEIKSLRRFAANMLRTYTGREPGELILKGQIRRGDVRTITAALMLVDLRDFTAMSDTLVPAAVIETLNRYFDCVMVPISQYGGEVMEIMGDGVLAIFNDNVEGGPDAACLQAFEAAKEGIEALARSNRSQPEGAPHLAAGFALHYGMVAYGNIGSGDRLDFTVVGRDVNLTSRIERLCRELDQQLIMSGAFVGRLQLPMFEIGHFALRGVPQMQLLFGLPPDP
jgi:adenylate cyclase